MCMPCVHTRASSWSHHLHIHNKIQTPFLYVICPKLYFQDTLDNLRENHPQVARRLRSLLHSETYPSEIAQSHRFCNRVQDAYTLRCAPQVFMVQKVQQEIYYGLQVHGIVHDTIDFVRGLITTEMNSATDNPIVLVSLTRSFSILATLSLILQPSSLKCL